MDRVRDWSHRATIVLVVTSILLIGPALAGIAASLPLAGVLLVLAAGLWYLREAFEQLPTVIGYDLTRYGPNVWLGPTIGAAMTLYWLGASPAEVQALGGIAGFVGMVNYFVRPVYLYVYFTVRRLLGGTNKRPSADDPPQ